ncbi:MAG: GTPase, partial [Candidatus Sedimenticola endophacoides]
VLAAGAGFLLLGPGRTMLRSPLPVIAVSAVRTGCGKSPVSRWIARRLRGEGLRVGVLRHPMPYGDLLRQRVQRFSSAEDLSAARCSVEEREEYEPHLREGSLVYAGVDYAAVLALARDEVDIIVWDGGNNDFPLLRPDLHLVLVDPLRPRDGQSHHPGEAVLRMADAVLVTKSDVATAEQLAEQAGVLRAHCPGVPVMHCELAIEVDAPERITGRRVLVVEDGPTLTHGGMDTGAGYRAARELGAASVVDPRRSAAPGVRALYERYRHIGRVLPAVGYHPAQLEELRATIAAADAESVVLATPCDLTRLIAIDKPVARVGYHYRERDTDALGTLLDRFIGERCAVG